MAIVICHTEGCAQDGIPRDEVVSWVESGVEHFVNGVWCGSCNQPIVDIDPPLPEPEPDPEPPVVPPVESLIALQEAQNFQQEQLDALADFILTL